MEPRQLHLPKPYVLGFLQQIRGTTSSPIHSEKRDHRLKATSNEVSVETWSAQSGKHGKSTVDQGENIPFLGFGSPPLLGFMLSPTDAMSPNHGQGAIPVQTARQTCGEAFISLVVWQPSSGQTVASPWNARRKLKFPTNVVAESHIS